MKLIVDPGQEDKLVDLYVDSWINDYKDEKNLAYKVIVAQCSLWVSPKKHRHNHGHTSKSKLDHLELTAHPVLTKKSFDSIVITL